jgi:4-diphosphocytidyl-2-C-methyl-D-erythritol kinase
LRLACPAKVNLSLEVLGRRADGYHDLRSVMVPISLADDLEVRLVPTPGIRVVVDGADLPAGPDNLVYRAAARLLETVRGQDAPGGTPGVDIRLVKRIPVGAGLGGGSSDAAGTLLALDRLLDTRLGESRLAAMGLEIGADVPFFVYGRPALATGVGERLSPLPHLPTLWLVLVNPGFQVSTAWVFREFAAARASEARLTPPDRQSTIDRFLQGPALAGLELRNDLETVTLRAYPVLEALKGELSASGAAATLMSGSGPTVFGIFLDEPAARAAEGRLRTSAGRRVFLAHSMTRGPA